MFVCGVVFVCAGHNFWNTCDLRLSSNWITCFRLSSGCSDLHPRPSHFWSYQRSTILLLYFGLLWFDRSWLSNRHNLSSEMKVNSILTWQNILSQGIHIKKKITCKYRSWRLDGVGEQDAMQVMPFIVFPDCYFKVLCVGNDTQGD